MKLYYSPGSCSLAAHIVIREGGINAEIVRVDLKTKQTEHGADFKAVNPKGYVPALVLVDGDLLTENMALLPYLATLAPNLFPQPSLGMTYWHATEMLGFVATELHKSFSPLFRPTFHDDAKKVLREHVATRLAMTADKLGDKPFILGDDFSVVDAYLFVVLMWAPRLGVALPASLAAYHARLLQRPSVQTAMREQGLL